MSNIVQLVYLMLPAYMANMTPPFVRYWKGWNRPISQRWLGDHKTVVGFCSGVVVAVAVTFVQSRIAWHAGLLPYTQWPLLGLAFGFGAMGGDSLKSLLKRRRGIPPGHRWIPMDQLDFVVGALIFVSPWMRFGFPDLAAILILSFAGDIAINQLSYRLGIRDTRW
jgi:CDP-2,3-bis-(O-geranylgeranyl)-sn-glycerol synthase